MFYRLVLVLAFSALTFSSGLLAQSVPLTLVPIAVGQATVGSSSLTVPVTYAVSETGAAANAAYYTRAVAFSESQIAAASRSRIAGAVAGAVAISAAILAVGYFLDYVTGDIYATAPTAGYDTANLSHVNSLGYQCPQSGLSAHVACIKATLAQNGYNDIRSNHATYDGTYSYFWYDSHHVAANFWLENQFYVRVAQFVLPSNHINGAELGNPGLPATDQQVFQAVANSPSALNQIFTSPVTGAVPRYQSILDQYPSVDAQYRAEHNLAPEAVTAPSVPNPQNEADTAPQATPWPSFCAWAKPVCDAIDWFKKAPPLAPPLPISNASINTVVWNSGFGSGTCPAPTSIALTMGTYSFSYQPVCDMSYAIRLMVVASSIILAMYMMTKGLFN